MKTKLINTLNLPLLIPTLHTTIIQALELLIRVRSAWWKRRTLCCSAVPPPRGQRHHGVAQRGGQVRVFFFFGVDCLIVTQYPPPTDLWDPGSRWASAPHSCPGSVTHSGEFLYVTVCLCGTATNKIRLDSAQGLIVQCCCNSKIKCVSVYV